MSLVRAVSTRWLAVILAVVLMTSPLTPVQHVAAADQNLVFAALHCSRTSMWTLCSRSPC